jgi:hypothetical protein
MRMKPWVLVVICVIGVPLLLATLALAQVGAVLQQVGQCTDPDGNDYCQKNIPPADNPCNVNPGPNCADWFRWFSNGLPCTNIPGMNVVWANNLATNGDSWSICISGTIPGSTCSMNYSVCGTVDG